MDNKEVISPLVRAVQKLSTAPTAEIPTLVDKINKLLDLRIANEIRVLKLIDEGLITVVDGVEVISDKALLMHKASKDSISELVKVRELLSGSPTERVSVEDETNQFSMERLVRMKNTQ